MIEDCLVIARPQQQARILQEELRGVLPTLVCPLLTIHPCTVEPTVAVLSCDIVIFVSLNAVDCAPLPLLCGDRPVVAVGEATALLLQKKGCRIVHYPEGSESGAEAALRLPVLCSVHQKNVAIVCGSRGRSLLSEVLTQRGAIVHQHVCYEQLAATHLPQTLVEDIRAQKRTFVWLLTSSEMVIVLQRLLVNSIPMEWKHTILLCSHDRIMHLATEVGYRLVYFCVCSAHNIRDLFAQHPWR